MQNATARVLDKCAPTTLDERTGRSRRPLPVPDLEALPPTAACTTNQVHLLSGFAVITLKKWRYAGRGPKVTLIEGKPRYLVRDLRTFMGLA